MFKFNFIPENDEESCGETNSESKETLFVESKEIFFDNKINILKNNSNTIKTKILNINNLEIKYLCSDSLIDILKTQSINEDSILKAEQNHSDLLPAVYEGGLKIWECTYDLLNYVLQNEINFKDKTVLDLGCGAGILGITSLFNGKSCWFQDYNIDVIHNITIPNVLLNFEKNIDRSKFFSGDWDSFVQLVKKNYPGQKFDYILTSETIYNTEYYNKLHLAFEDLLKKDGVIFLAAKSFYFGVGGGIHLFQDFLDNKMIFKYKNCWESAEGVKRNILQIEFL